MDIEWAGEVQTWSRFGKMNVSLTGHLYTEQTLQTVVGVILPDRGWSRCLEMVKGVWRILGGFFPLPPPLPKRGVDQLRIESALMVLESVLDSGFEVVHVHRCVWWQMANRLG